MRNVLLPLCCATFTLLAGIREDLANMPDADFEGKTVSTDAQKLIRIFDNAFSNLYKYADRNKPIKVDVFVDACQIKIEILNFIRHDGELVESNGIGLKTCDKLAEFIGAEFEHGGDDVTYFVKLRLPLSK